MAWLVIAITAYFILAIVNLADKFMVDKVIPHPKTYAFLVGIGGLIVLLAAPWGLTWPGFTLWLVDILVGSFFTIALLLLYQSLKFGEASRVFTMIGGLVPIFTIIFSIFILGERFNAFQWIAIFFLIFGTVLIVWLPVTHSAWANIKTKIHLSKKSYKLKSIKLAIFAAIMFALFWVGSKYVFNTQVFISGFIWIRVGSFLAAMSFLFTKKNRKDISDDLKNSSNKGDNKIIFFATQGLAAVGSIMQNYAVSIASVAIVTALQGLQYAFLLAISGVISLLFPKILKEDNNKQILIQKFLAVFLISLGLYFLAKN